MTNSSANKDKSSQSQSDNAVRATINSRDISTSLNNYENTPSKGTKQKRKYNFQRATVACEQCRKAKTRCNYLNDGSSCFRCENLSLTCSLQDLQSEPIRSTFQQNTSIKSRDEVDSKPEKKRQRKSKLNSIPLNEHPNVKFSSVKPENIDEPSFSSAAAATDNNTLLNLINSKVDSITQTLNVISYNSGGGRQLHNDLYYSGSGSTCTQTHGGAHMGQLGFNQQQQPQLQLQHPQQAPNESLLKMYPQSSTLMHQASSGVPSPINMMGLLPNSNSRNSLIIHPPTAHAPLARPFLQPTTRFLTPLQSAASSPQTKSNFLTNTLNPTSGHENDEFFFLNAPYLDVLNIASNFGMPFSKEIGFDITKDTFLQSIQERYDLINRNILDYDTCYRLIEIAILHYGKWITYAESDFKLWFDMIRFSSPLLFCTLVLFGLRHHRLNHTNESLELDILQSVHQLFSLSVYEVPQSKEFLQTVILLTYYSPSLSYKHIYFDSWWISSYGLIHFMTREMNMNLLVKSVRSPDKIHQYRIWNHLTVSHLINCILSGRPCIIDEPRLDQCRDILDLPETSSFDAIIVAAICLILSLYNSLQFPEKTDVSLKEVESTYSDWKYLTESITLGKSVTSIYFFAKFMIIRRYILKNMHLKGQPEHNKRCREFFNTFVSFSDFMKLVDFSNSSDLLKQCVFLSVFMALQFIQLGLFNEENDTIELLKGVNNYLDQCAILESKIFCFNGYFGNYSELIRRMKDLIFAKPQQNQQGQQ